MSLLLLKTLLRNLILPPAGPLLLAFFGVAVRMRRPVLAYTCVLTGLAALWLLSTPIIADALSGLAEGYPALDLRQSTGAQAIVILGGGGQITRAPEYGGPSAEPLLLERLSYGAFVAHKTGLPILITGSGIEANAMYDTLQRNFNTDVHWIDNKAGDTFENARNSVGILKQDHIHRIVLVTHATQMRRAAHEFEAAGMDVVPAPMGIISSRGHGILQYFPGPQALLHSYEAIYELLGEPVRAFFAVTHIRRQ